MKQRIGIVYSKCIGYYTIGFDVYSAGMELKSEVNEENLSQDASTSGQTRSVKGNSLFC